MSLYRKNSQSAPECQLSKPGDAQSQRVLAKATARLSEFELAALEKDLEYYDGTGLIGVHMSRLLVLLETKASTIAA